MSGDLITVDASALAAVIFSEPRGETVWQAVKDRPLVAPAVLQFELANVAAKKIRTYPGQHQVAAIISSIDNLLIDFVDVPLTDMVTIALETGLSSYDAAYLQVSLGLDIPLATLDVKLASAAQGMGIECIFPE